MSRFINSHIVNPANDRITIEAMDEPGSGGAHHVYRLGIEGPGHDPTKSPSRDVLLCFQNGPIAEAGVNGITHEALLAVLIDRLRCFQAGPFACRENAIALTKMEYAAMWLAKRTRDRMARGVEGTHEK